MEMFSHSTPSTTSEWRQVFPFLINNIIADFFPPTVSICASNRKCLVLLQLHSCPERSFKSTKYNTYQMPEYRQLHGFSILPHQVLYTEVRESIDLPSPVISENYKVPRCAPLTHWDDEQLLQTA